MKVSNCCGADGRVNHPVTFIVDDWITWEQYELCPKCGEHCEYIEETTFETMTLINMDEYKGKTATLKTHFITDDEHSLGKLIPSGASVFIKGNESNGDCYCEYIDFGFTINSNLLNINF